MTSNGDGTCDGKPVRRATGPRDGTGPHGSSGSGMRGGDRGGLRGGDRGGPRDGRGPGGGDRPGPGFGNMPYGPIPGMCRKRQGPDGEWA